MKKIFVAVLMAASVTVAACGGDTTEADVKAMVAQSEKVQTTFDLNSAMTKASAAKTKEEKSGFLKEFSGKLETIEKDFRNVSVSNDEVKKIRDQVADSYKKMKAAYDTGAKAVETDDAAGAQKMVQELMDAAKQQMEAEKALQKIATDKKIDLTKK